MSMIAGWAYQIRYLVSVCTLCFIQIRYANAKMVTRFSRDSRLRFFYMRNCFSNWFAPLRAPCSGLWSMSEYRMADGRNAAQLAPHALPTKYPRYLARHHSPSLAFPLELSTAADESSKVRLCPRVLTSMRISIRISGGASLKAWLAHLRGADHASSRSRP